MLGLARGSAQPATVYNGRADAFASLHVALRSAAHRTISSHCSDEEPKIFAKTDVFVFAFGCLYENFIRAPRYRQRLRAG